MKTIQEIQSDIVEEFSVFTDWMDKYEYLIDLGKGMPLIDEKDKTEANLIRGCQSRVWLSCREEDGRLHFAADSDAIITKGIISLLLKVYDGQTPADILAADEEFIEKIGLRENLSPTRANGLVSMIQTIKAHAAAAKASSAAPASGRSIDEDIVLALRQVYDPEIPVNIYDLGLIYDIQADADGQVFIKMTLTAPNCPIADDVVAQVREAVADVPGVRDVQVDLVFEPEWTTDLMSEEAKLELGML
ncbi:MAG: SufE family protein [Bacteroidales bacterium]|jgi:SufE protein probably involved in Fe-S center assembly|nr:SufE family protein [Bacteroidales bacterium]MBR0500805.1 SufE family protein [Bacteroidales bacterium]